MSNDSLDLNQLEGHQFEDVIEKLIQKMGFVTEERKRSADGGVDILAMNHQPILAGKYVIQCKRYSKPVQVGIIRDLYGVVHSRNANKGILITNSTFTQPAVEFSSGKQLELIDGEKLLQLLTKYELLEPSSVTYNIPNGMKIFQISLFEPLTRIATKMNDYSKGLIYVNKKEYTIDEWLDNNVEMLDKLEEYPPTMENIMNEMLMYINSDEAEDIQKIQGYVKYIVDANEILLRDYIELYSIEPPEIVNNLHKISLKMFESMLDDWMIFKDDCKIALENPPEDGNVLLTLVFKEDAIKEYLTEFERVRKILIPPVRARPARSSGAGGSSSATV